MNGHIKKTRKQLRKERRNLKKVHRNEYNSKQFHRDVLPNSDKQKVQTSQKKNASQKPKIVEPKISVTKLMDNQVRTEINKVKKFHQDARKQRRINMSDTVDDDKEIKKLEKLLKIKKNLPKSFKDDGLDYLLDLCNPENMKAAASLEQELAGGNNNFYEDLNAVSNKLNKNSKLKKGEVHQTEDDREDFNDSDSYEEDDDNQDLDENERYSSNSEDEEYENLFSDNDSENEDIFDDGSKNCKSLKLKKSKTFDKTDRVNESDGNSEISEEDDENILSDDSDDLVSNSSLQTSKAKKRKKSKFNDEANIQKNKMLKLHHTKQTNTNSDNNESSDNDESGDNDEETNNRVQNEVWEDIYGRLRDKSGEVIEEKKEKYILPALRANKDTNNDKKRDDKLLKLKRQLRALLNKLGDQNMQKTANDIETLFTNNSRNDMNETLTNLILELVMQPAEISPMILQRTLLYYTVLLTVLHANVGTEVGAHFLQNVIKRFSELVAESLQIEDRRLDNVVYLISQLYNFKIFHVKLLFEVLEKLSEEFSEKNIENILIVLENVGFSMRKDDPISLKNMILNLQSKANNSTKEMKNNSRVKFMVDTLLAIKNNNIAKIRGCDTSQAEEFKKLIKGYLKKDSQITTLNISLKDLLKAEEYGKWWVVGSAWTGKEADVEENKNQTTSNCFSQKLLDLARTQRMNTETRRKVFCILMSAEDYLDAFEQLLRLGLKNHEENDIINVILHCCLQEKAYNPYYAYLAQKFCEYNRRFQQHIKMCIWDKLKVLQNCSAIQMSNVTKFLTYLFLEKALPISILKKIEFSELDQTMIRFLNQILFGIIMCENQERCQEIFIGIAKLHQLSANLKLFIQHFLLQKSLNEDNNLLKSRIKNIVKILQ